MHSNMVVATRNLVLVLWEHRNNSGGPALRKHSLLNQLGQHRGRHGLGAGSHMNQVARRQPLGRAVFAHASRGDRCHTVFVQDARDHAGCDG